MKTALTPQQRLQRLEQQYQRVLAGSSARKIDRLRELRDQIIRLKFDMGLE